MNEQVGRVIDLAEQVGGAAWPLLVRGAWIDGAAWLTFSVVLLVSTGVFVAWCIRTWPVEDTYRTELAQLFRQVGGVVGTGLFILAATGVATNIPRVVCPECATAWHILEGATDDGD